MNSILGADRFIFYSHNVSSVLFSDLDHHLIHKYNINIYDWAHPVSDIHYYGQLAAIQDCLYRTMLISRYAVFSDLDEVIVPVQDYGWHQLMASLQADVNHNYGAYMFRHVLYNRQFPSQCPRVQIRRDDRSFSLPAVLCHVDREKRINQHGDRTKLIVSPHKILILGVHNVWRYMEGAMDYFVPIEQGLLHHYRYWDKNMEHVTYIQNKLMFKYKAELLQRLSKT